MINDVTINDVSLYEILDLIFKSISISPPKPKYTIIDVPGTSDVIDLTESITGDIEYSQRILKITLESMCGKDAFYAMSAKLNNLVHGRKATIVFANDPGFYWAGRISVDSFIWKKYGGTVTLSATVDPYKYETQSSLEPWDWDTFSFEDGIIRDYFDITVPKSITIVGRRKKVCPKFICSGAMTVTYLGNTYNLATGENVVGDIFLGEGSHVLTFSGFGTVSVDYRGASL